MGAHHFFPFISAGLLPSILPLLRSFDINPFSGFRGKPLKETVGFAGFDLESISHLEQRVKGRASKGQLMAWVDRGLRELGWNEQETKPFPENLECALNQGAYVIQTL